jgi:hypothetical protein
MSKRKPQCRVCGSWNPPCRDADCPRDSRTDAPSRPAFQSKMVPPSLSILESQAVAALARATAAEARVAALESALRRWLAADDAWAASPGTGKDERPVAREAAAAKDAARAALTDAPKETSDG